MLERCRECPGDFAVHFVGGVRTCELYFFTTARVKYFCDAGAIRVHDRACSADDLQGAIGDARVGVGMNPRRMEICADTIFKRDERVHPIVNVETTSVERTPDLTCDHLDRI